MLTGLAVAVVALPVAAEVASGSMTSSAELDSPMMISDVNNEEFSPEFDCLSEKCPTGDDVDGRTGVNIPTDGIKSSSGPVHRVVARALNSASLPPSIQQLMYNLLRELDVSNGLTVPHSALINSGTGHSMPIRTIPIALLLQQLHDRSAGLASSSFNPLPIAITPIRKQRGNLKMANRFGKRDRLRLSNRFGK